MDLDEDAVRKAADVFARVARPKVDPAPRGATVRGAGNVVGNGNVVVMFGTGGALSDTHSAALDDLVDQVVFHETLRRGKPYRAALVRMHLRKALNLSAQLEEADFPRMERYLRGWLARAANKADPGRDEKWRKRRIARILARSNELGRVRQLDLLLATRFGAAILIELGDDELDEVFKLVSTWL
jgi:hypothetical protein